MQKNCNLLSTSEMGDGNRKSKKYIRENEL